MLSNRQSAFLLAAALMALCALPGRSSPDGFKWTGNSQANSNDNKDNWDDPQNWQKLWGDTNRQWPSHDNDVATIDDTTPQAVVDQNASNLGITDLTLGDGHTLNLTQGLYVSGTLECEGAVILKGNGPLTASKVFRVYADQDTTITFESGTGHLQVDGGV